MSERIEFSVSQIDKINLVLNRARLANFVTQFTEDKDLRDLLIVDLLGSAIGLPLSSTGLKEGAPILALRPFRMWEYMWLYKSLGLSAGKANILDLGGPASHLSILAALAGCSVTSIDINPEFVRAGQECARALKLESLEAREGDMRDLSAFPNESFDRVTCCSVLEHLTGEDQEVALREIGRVLKPGGVVGLTFDYGPAAPGANEHLPPPHEPPPTAAEALRRYLQGGLVLLGDEFSEDPTAGALFDDEYVRYTVACLILGKPPAPRISVPHFESNGSALDGFIQKLPFKAHEIAARIKGLIEQQQYAVALEAIAAERLAGMREKEELIKRLDTEVRTLTEEVRTLTEEGWIRRLTRRRSRVSAPLAVAGGQRTVSEFLEHNQRCIDEARTQQRREKRKRRLLSIAALLIAVGSVVSGLSFSNSWLITSGFLLAFVVLCILHIGDLEGAPLDAIAGGGGLAIGILYQNRWPVAAGLSIGFIRLFLRLFSSDQRETLSVNVRQHLANILNRNGGGRPHPWDVQYIFPHACGICCSLRVLERQFKSEQEVVSWAPSTSSQRRSTLHQSGHEWRCEACKHEWVQYDRIEPFGLEGRVFNHSYGPVIKTESAWLPSEVQPPPRLKEIVPSEVLAELKQMWDAG